MEWLYLLLSILLLGFATWGLVLRGKWMDSFQRSEERRGLAFVSPLFHKYLYFPLLS